MDEDMRFCPNCGSRRVEPDTADAAAVAIYGGNNQSWRCEDCDYTGVMPTGDPDKKLQEGEEAPEELPEEIEFEPMEDYEKVDLTFGKGYSKYVIYVSIPLAVIFVVMWLLR